MTAVQAVHLPRIGSLEAIEAAKGELLEALPADGTAILNADDPIVRAWTGGPAARVVSYGFAEDADVRAEDVASAGPAGMRFILQSRRRQPRRDDPDPRPAVGAQRRWPRPRSGWRPVCRWTRSSPGSKAAGRRRTAPSSSACAA